MAQGRVKTIEDSDRIRSRSNTGSKGPAQQRSEAERSPRSGTSEAMAEETRTRIEKLAYELYQQRGQQDGYDCQDWLEAERLILSPTAHTHQDGAERLLTSFQA